MTGSTQQTAVDDAPRRQLIGKGGIPLATAHGAATNEDVRLLAAGKTGVVDLQQDLER